MNKNLLGIIVIVLVLLGGYFLFTNYFVGTRVTENDRMGVDTSLTIDLAEAEEGSYTANPEKSEITWEGRKTLIVDYKDTGSLSLSSGTVELKDGVLSGEIVFDMESIAVSSTGRKAGEDFLEQHLKSADFFDVETFPKATFTFKDSRLVNVEDPTLYQMQGTLTVKGIENAISFPARVFEQDGALVASAEVSLDRTLWDIRFGSGKFFSDLGDGVIDDFFTVRFRLVAE